MRTTVFALCLAVAAEPAWRTDWNEAFETAKREHRLVFVDHFAKWCKPCVERSDRFPRAASVQLLSSFVLLVPDGYRIDVDLLLRRRW